MLCFEIRKLGKVRMVKVLKEWSNCKISFIVKLKCSKAFRVVNIKISVYFGLAFLWEQKLGIDIIY